MAGLGESPAGGVAAVPGVGDDVGLVVGEESGRRGGEGERTRAIVLVSYYHYVISL